MSFGAPLAFSLLFLIVAMALAGAWLLRWRERARASFAGQQAAAWRAAPLWPRLSLLLLAGVLIVIAAARPQWGSRELTRERRGIDLVIALDISQSMLATDVAPTRLKLAQDELVRLVEAERGNRVGLVFFAGSAILRSPLTTDTLALSQLIRRADIEGGLTRTGSDLGSALTEAARILEGSESNGRAVLLVSDGEDHVGNYASSAADLASKGIVLYTAGVGTPQGTTLTETDSRGQPHIKRDASGNPVVTRLQDGSLRAIASQGGGRYIPLEGSGSLRSLRDDLAGLQQTPLGQEDQRVPLERFQFFVAPALALLVCAWFLPPSLSLPRLRLRLASARPQPALPLLLLALLLGACSSGDGDPVRKANEAANRLYDAGDYEAALSAYQELLAQRPDVPELSVNAGNALHRLGRFDRAALETQRALPPTDARLGAITFYNLGNHLLAQEEFEQAFDAYRNALLLDPSDRDAKHNLELTLLLLSQRQQEQQPGGAPNGQQGNEGEQQQEEPDAQPGEAAPQRPNQQPQQDGAAQQQAQRELQEALRGIDEELTVEEAVRILDLLRQQQQQPRPGTQPRGAGPDY